MPSPLFFSARWVYTSYCNHHLSSQTNSIRVVSISDTHNTHRLQPPLPDGDILVHSGD
ncbi:hypothetical protein AN958_07738 [Leucoagaricus sp. SymC.cos]|nr:hypothetical protein AN958_07738 [Leucoagaricus sp. SymC.cos]